MIEKYQNIQCSTACWVWGCKVTDQLECPCPPLKVPTMDMCTSEVGNRRRWPALLSPPFLLHHAQLCVCVLLSWKRDGSRIYDQKKANWQRQCDLMKPFGMKRSQYLPMGPGIVSFTPREFGPIP